MDISRVARFARISTAAAILGLALASGVLTGCSSKNADVSCSGNACTATFVRNADSEVSVLGLKVKLVNVQNNQVQIKVGSQTITVPVGQQAQVLNGRFTIEVQQVNNDNVVVKINRNSG